MVNDASESSAQRPQSRSGYELELLASVLMALAVVATAYSAWQATRWSGVQAKSFAEAGSLRNQSLAAMNTANAQISYDATTFRSVLVRVPRPDSR